MKAKLKKCVGPALIIVSLAIVLISGITGGALPGAIAVMRTVSLGFLGFGILSYLGSLLMDAVSVRSALRSEGYHISLREALFSSVKGNFYSNVTPGAAGGQPMQIQRLNQCGVPVGAGTSAVMSHFIAQHIMLTVLTVALGIPYLGFALNNVGASWPILAVGLIYNTVMVSGALLLCFSRKAVRWLVDKAAMLAEKLHLTKEPQRLREKWLNTADTFHASMTHMKEHPAEMFRQLAYGAIQLLLMMSVLYFVYLGLGLSGAALGQILMMGLCQHVSAAYMPLPGASGAQEGVFGLYFSQLMPGSACLAGMLIWRFVTYYLGLLLGGIVCLADRKPNPSVEHFRRNTLIAKISAAREELKTVSTAGKKHAMQKLRQLEAELSAYEGHLQLARSR